jgi:hypothetical protein
VVQPGAGTATDNDTNITFTAPDANGTTTFTYQASDGNLNSSAATVTVSHVKNDPRGDCNGSGSVTAADFTSVVLEIFDASDDPLTAGSPAWWRIYEGGFGGSPLDCDANASENGSSDTSDSVTAADIICTVLVFFDYTSCTQPTSQVRSASVATLAAPQAQPALAGNTVDVALSLDSGDNRIAAAAFALQLDSAGTWQSVEGWRARVQDGHVRWSVQAEDFGTGPFRWSLSAGKDDPPQCTSSIFYLPSASRAEQVVGLSNCADSISTDRQASVSDTAHADDEQTYVLRVRQEAGDVAQFTIVNVDTLEVRTFSSFENLQTYLAAEP